MVSVTPRPSFTPRGKDPGTHWIEAGWAPEPVWTQGLEEKSYAPIGDRTPIVQSVVTHYTAWATVAPTTLIAVVNQLLPSNVRPNTDFALLAFYCGFGFYLNKSYILFWKCHINFQGPNCVVLVLLTLQKFAWPAMFIYWWQNIKRYNVGAPLLYVFISY
jgi:hypothetical protein